MTMTSTAIHLAMSPQSDKHRRIPPSPFYCSNEENAISTQSSTVPCPLSTAAITTTLQAMNIEHEDETNNFTVCHFNCLSTNYQQTIIDDNHYQQPFTKVYQTNMNLARIWQWFKHTHQLPGRKRRHHSSDIRSINFKAVQESNPTIRFIHSSTSNGLECRIFLGSFVRLFLLLASMLLVGGILPTNSAATTIATTLVLKKTGKRDIESIESGLLSHFVRRTN